MVPVCAEDTKEDLLRIAVAGAPVVVAHAAAAE